MAEEDWCIALPNMYQVLELKRALVRRLPPIGKSLRVRRGGEMSDGRASQRVPLPHMSAVLDYYGDRFTYLLRMHNGVFEGPCPMCMRVRGQPRQQIVIDLNNDSWRCPCTTAPRGGDAVSLIAFNEGFGTRADAIRVAALRFR